MNAITDAKRIKISEEAFAYSDLREDNLYAHIPPEKRRYYITMGLKAGKRAAAQYSDADLHQLLAKDGVVIQRHLKPSPVGLRSQIWYEGKTKRIDLFVNTALQISCAMEKTPWPVTPEQVEKLLLAHEFYHWIEYSTGVFTAAQCDPLPVKVFGLFQRKAPVRSVNEIAAFAFSYTWCKAPVHPRFMDYMLICERDGKDPTQGWEAAKRLQEEYESACEATT